MPPKKPEVKPKLTKKQLQEQRLLEQKFEALFFFLSHKTREREEKERIRLEEEEKER